MTITKEQLISRLQQFTDQSLAWCIQESEGSTTRVTMAIEMLLQKTEGVSHISEESLQIVLELKNSLGDFFTARPLVNLEKLTKNFQTLAKEHQDIANIIHPIIQALQFQDKLRQNLENASKMLKAWQEFRQNHSGDLNPDELDQFGHKLLKLTTMKSERDVIRSHFENLPPEEEPPSVMLF